jgi:hypothetical protein
MPIASNPDVAPRPDPIVELIPAILDAITIRRLLSVSRPTAYEVLAQCRPFKIGRLLRCSGDDFRLWLERQRVTE